MLFIWEILIFSLHKRKFPYCDQIKVYLTWLTLPYLILPSMRQRIIHAEVSRALQCTLYLDHLITLTT